MLTVDEDIELEKHKLLRFKLNRKPILHWDI